MSPLFPERLIQFGCNQLDHRTGTFSYFSGEITRKRNPKSEIAAKNLIIRRFILDIISEIDDRVHFLMF